MDSFWFWVIYNCSGLNLILSQNENFENQVLPQIFHQKTIHILCIQLCNHEQHKKKSFFTYIFVLLDFSNNFNFDSIWKWVWNIFLKNNNFHYEGVKRGTFGYTLGIWEVKWHLNLLWNICRHLPQLCYIIIMVFLYCILTQYLIESPLPCNTHFLIFFANFTIFSKMSL